MLEKDFGAVWIDIAGLTLTSEEASLLQHSEVGGVLLFSRNYQDKNQLLNLTRHIRCAADRQILIAVDHEGGRVWRFKEGFTHLPPAQDFGRLYTHEPEIALRHAHLAGQVLACELLQAGIDLSFAPVLDLNHGMSQVIGDRAWSADPQIVIRLAGAFIAGMHSVGMAAVGKHFPGHGGCTADSHTEYPVDLRALGDLNEQDILPFRALAPVLAGMMPAHVVYSQIDTQPAGYSPYWLKTLLRENMGFSGVIISDCLSMQAAILENALPYDRVQRALSAGCDMVILSQQEVPTLRQVLASLQGRTTQAMRQHISRLKGDFQKAIDYAEQPLPPLAELWSVG
jgi:beta-N-acetylhexosaminidase